MFSWTLGLILFFSSAVNTSLIYYCFVIVEEILTLEEIVSILTLEEISPLRSRAIRRLVLKILDTLSHSILGFLYFDVHLSW